MEHLIELLQQMFKNNHDGMIITEGDKILVHNSTTETIFCTQLQAENNFDLESNRTFDKRSLIQNQ